MVTTVQNECHDAPLLSLGSYQPSEVIWVLIHTVSAISVARRDATIRKWVIREVIIINITWCRAPCIKHMSTNHLSLLFPRFRSPSRSAINTNYCCAIPDRKACVGGFLRSHHLIVMARRVIMEEVSSLCICILVILCSDRCKKFAFVTLATPFCLILT
jgi:hypothetical protein